VYWKHIENYSKSKEEKCVRSLHCPMPRTTLLRVRPTVLTTMVSTNRPTLDTSMNVSRYSDCDTLDNHNQEKEVMEDSLDIHDEQEKEDLQESYDDQESDDKQCKERGELENDDHENNPNIKIDTNNVDIEDVSKDNHENCMSVNIDTERCPAVDIPRAEGVDGGKVMCVIQTNTGVDVSMKILTVLPGDKNILSYKVVERKYQSLKIEDIFALREDVLVVQEGVHVCQHGPGVQCGYKVGAGAQPVACRGHQIWDPGIACL